MIDSPSKLARMEAIARLSDPNWGFNYYHSTCADDYNVPAITIDFNGNSNNFYEAEIDPRQFQLASNFNYPILCIFTPSAKNLQDRAIGSIFDGEVTIGIDVFISFDQAAAMQNYESYADAVELAMVNTFNPLRHPMPNVDGIVMYKHTMLPITSAGNRLLLISLQLGAHITSSDNEHIRPTDEVSE